MNAELAALLLVPIAYVLMWVVEARRPARPYVPVAGWRGLGALFFVVVAVTGTLTPLVWKSVGLTDVRLFDLSRLGWWGYPVGLVVISGIAYWWHRAAHRFDILWRATHQLHHSAQRIDVPGAFFSHPLEVVMKTTLGLIGGTVVLGLAPPVAAMISSTLAFLSIFQHWNIDTPRWLGYVVPRPEMHAYHHELEKHGRNYGDLPIWDMLFGTYFNPARFDGVVGFGFDISGRIGDMLLWRDVNATGGISEQLHSVHTKKASSQASSVV
jgi:sterol desaturase/sphingolipid hydroxylase (fatty acid hydroxylase superfamily)